MTPVIPDAARYVNAGLVPLPPRLKLHPDSPFDQTETLVLDAATLQAAQGKHPLGFNVRPNVGYARLLTQVKAMGGCECMTFECDASALWNLREFRPWVNTLIWRPRAKSGETWTSETLHEDFASPEGWVNAMHFDMQAAGFAIGDLWLYLHNESGWRAAMIEWERRATEFAVEKLGKVIALNPGVGTPEPDQIALAQPVIELAQRYPEQVLIGLHEYMSVFGNRSAPWYLNRWSFWPDGVRFVITEAGAEDIDDDHPYTATLPRIRGCDFIGPVHANDAAWAATYGAAYPGKDAQYLRELQTAWDVGRWGDPRIAGVCLFSWGDGGGRWADYDVSGMGVFLAGLTEWRPMVAQPIDPYREIVAELQHLEPGETLNVRSDKTTSAPVVERIEAGATFGYIWPPVAGQDIGPAPDGRPRGNLWVAVKVRGVTGYAHKYYLALPEDEPAPTPEPDPPTPPDESDGTPTLSAADWARLEARFDAIDTRLARYDKLIGVMLEFLAGLQAGENSRSQAVTLSIQEALTQMNDVQTEEVA